jgi:hypothetical protein
MPKSNTSKEASTKIVDVAGIDTRMFTLPREVLTRVISVRKSAEAIVVAGNEP